MIRGRIRGRIRRTDSKDKAEKGKKKQRRKRSPLQIIKSALDALWSKLVRKRDGKCVLCGKEPPEWLCAHHWIVNRRASMAIRWLILNGVTLCYGCHQRVHETASADTVLRIREYMRTKGLDDEEYERILKLGHGIVKWTMDELRQLKVAFTEKLNEPINRDEADYREDFPR